MIRKYRDVQLIEKDLTTYLAVACDVSAYIGPKENDVVKVSAECAGYYATVVPLMEVISIGAMPLSVIDTLGVEMTPTGLKVIEGVKKAMAECQIPEECLTGSTEDNMPTASTTIGVTVVGELEKESIQSYRPKAGQFLMVVGIPKMGAVFLKEEIIEKQGQVIDVATVTRVRKAKGVGHMLPIGSKGIEAEMKVLLELEGLTLNGE